MSDNSIVLDSSVIAAVFFPEQYSDWAEKIVAKHEVLYTVDIAFAEIANVAWKRIVIYRHDENAILDALKDALNFIKDVCDVLTTFSLHQKAIEIAVNEKITFYDALFLAASNIKNTRLATLDKHLAQKLSSTRFRIIHPYES